MPLPTITQKFTHALDYPKGWSKTHALDFAGRLDPAIDPTAQPVFGGRAVHVSGNTPLAGGAGTVNSLLALGAVGTQMAIFLHQGQMSYDVQNFGNGQVDPYGWTAARPDGTSSGLVASGGFELTTTEFDKTNGVVYNPNDLLHACAEVQITTGTDKSMAGLLFKAKNWPGGGGGVITAYADNVCGVVSRGSYINHNRTAVVTFWPVYLPGSSPTT